MNLSPFFDLRHDSNAVQMTVYAQGSTVRLSRNVRSGDLYTMVSFSQDNYSRRGRQIDAEGERVSLRIRTTNFAKPQPPLDDIQVSAGSFAELLRRHPGPTARHLAPLFRAFGQDAVVFRVDPRVAWQLFPDAAEADEMMISKAQGIVARLDSPDFRQRELATHELESLGGPALALLNDLDQSTLSPEQCARIDAILKRHAPLDDTEVSALLQDTEFLLRCFTYSEVDVLRAAAVRHLESVTHMEPGLSADAKLPARIQAADQFRERMTADP
jgi:hypothetical protein